MCKDKEEKQIITEEDLDSTIIYVLDKGADYLFSLIEANKYEDAEFYLRKVVENANALNENDILYVKESIEERNRNRKHKLMEISYLNNFKGYIEGMYNTFCKKYSRQLTKKIKTDQPILDN